MHKLRDVYLHNSSEWTNQGTVFCVMKSDVLTHYNMGPALLETLTSTGERKH